jgi:hypothetical protein
MLSVCPESVDALSASAESIILSGPPAESMISTLSTVWSYYFAMLTAGATKKTTIGDTYNCRLRTLVNSASTAPPIGLPPKGTKFCHTSNILLVGHQCLHALLRLCFNSSARGWSVGQSVGQSVGRLFGWSVGRSVGWSVGQSVGRSVGRWVGQSVGWLVSWSVSWSISRLVGRSVCR